MIKSLINLYLSLSKQKQGNAVYNAGKILLQQYLNTQYSELNLIQIKKYIIILKSSIRYIVYTIEFKYLSILEIYFCNLTPCTVVVFKLLKQCQY